MKELFSTLLSKARSTSRAMIKSSFKTIYEREAFLELIELERDRVHRDDQQFSLILIDVNENDNAVADTIALVHKISKRVRRIDQLGWYDNNHLGILLPNTTQAGAQIIANDICQSRDGANSAIAFKTSSYPDERPLSAAKVKGLQSRDTKGESVVSLLKTTDKTG
jgi:PleD family two-component response regulator